MDTDILPIVGSSVGAVLVFIMYYLSHYGFHSHCWSSRLRLDMDIDTPPGNQQDWLRPAAAALVGATEETEDENSRHESFLHSYQEIGYRYHDKKNTESNNPHNIA